MIIARVTALVMAAGLAWASYASKPEKVRNASHRPLSAAAQKAARAKWEASPDGVAYNAWKASPAGRKVFAAETNIRVSVSEFTAMDAVITCLYLPPGSNLGYGMMVKIKGEDYILALGPEAPDNETLQLLGTLKPNDTITIKAHQVSHAPKYAFSIISAAYVEKNGQVIFRRAPQKGGC